MMRSVQPITEQEAQGETRTIYIMLKQALGSRHIPAFFTYIAPFHEYFSYIAEQLVANLQDQRFATTIAEMKQEMIPLIGEQLRKSEETVLWINRYQYSPSFYNFQQNIDTVFTINLKLAFIFVALREAVKGWAVAAKKLPSNASSGNHEPSEISEDAFIYDISELSEYGDKQTALTTQQYGLVRSQPSPLEKDLLQEYFALCHMDFSGYMKKDYFWILRIGLEQMILHTLPTLPKLISSPINAVLHLTEKYDPTDLIYYLAEDFPTSSIHRMMFSGYMKVDGK